jgi:hypothetical protein
MAPFRYDTPETSPLVGTIADIIQRGGLLQGQNAQALAEINARAQAQSGALWGRAIENISQIPTQLGEQKRRDALANSEIAVRDVQLKGAQAQQQQQQQQREGEQYLAGLIKQYQDPNTGEIDAEKVANFVSAKYPGVGEQWLKHYSDAQGDLGKLRAAKTAHSNAEEVLIANAAAKAADPGDFLARIGTAKATGDLSPTRIAQIQKDFSSTDDWDALKQQYIDRGNELLPKVKLNEGDKLLSGIDQQVLADNPKPKPAAPKVTTAEQELDAYAVTKYGAGADRSKLTFGDLQALEQQKAAAKSKAAIAQHVAERNYDVANPIPVKDKSQDELEKDYRTALRASISNRSGGIGQEDQKVRQANDLIVMMNQFYNPKTGGYDIPRVQMNELGLGLAKLVAPNSAAGVQMLEEFSQKTAKGDTAALWTYLTGKPEPANTQEITKVLRDSIERQGKVSEQQRNAELDYLRGTVLPTNLEDARRDAINKAAMVPLYRTREIQNPTTGERRIQTSMDGGKTWR